MVNFVNDAIPIFLDTLPSLLIQLFGLGLCFLWFLLCFYGFSCSFKVFYFFKFIIVNDAIFCWNIDYLWLFAMVANHQSIDAMFAMYRSSLDISIFTSIKKFTLKKMRDHLTWRHDKNQYGFGLYISYDHQLMFIKFNDKNIAFVCTMCMGLSFNSSLKGSQANKHITQ